MNNNIFHQSSQLLNSNNGNKDNSESIKTLKTTMEDISNKYEIPEKLDLTSKKISPRQIAEKYVEYKLPSFFTSFPLTKLDMNHLPQKVLNNFTKSEANILRWFISRWRMGWKKVHPRQLYLSLKEILDIHPETVSRGVINLKKLGLLDYKQSRNPSNGYYNVNEYFPGKKLLGFCGCVLDWWKGSEGKYPAQKRYRTLLKEFLRSTFLLAIETKKKKINTIRRKSDKIHIKNILNMLTRKEKQRIHET